MNSNSNSSIPFDLPVKESRCNELIETILDLPKLVLFGEELIELDGSMVRSGLCHECEKQGYCIMMPTL